MQKITLALATLVAMSSVQASDDLLRCRQIGDSAKRLSCYDAINVNAMPVATATKAAPNPADFGLPQKVVAPVVAPAEFGLPKKAAPPAEEEGVDTSSAATFEGWDPKVVLELANGQKWQITDSSSVFVAPRARKVKIRRGVLGGFYMEVEGINQVAKVKRIK
jgi:hypothetical protein